MAHVEQKVFCESVREKFPLYFRRKFVLDVGSLDINGNNGYLFDECLYIGVDISEGQNVDICSPGHLVHLPDNTFDAVISTECFEHDRFYERTFLNMARMLKPGGLFIFTCATVGREEHGTRRTTPDDAPLLQGVDEWQDYYKNLVAADFLAFGSFEEIFEQFEFSQNEVSHDLYFWGLKKGQFVERENYSNVVQKSYLLEKYNRSQAECLKLGNSLQRLQEDKSAFQHRMLETVSDLARFDAPLRFEDVSLAAREVAKLKRQVEAICTEKEAISRASTQELSRIQADHAAKISALSEALLAEKVAHENSILALRDKNQKEREELIVTSNKNLEKISEEFSKKIDAFRLSSMRVEASFQDVLKDYSDRLGKSKSDMDHISRKSEALTEQVAMVKSQLNAANTQLKAGEAKILALKAELDALKSMEFQERMSFLLKGKQFFRSRQLLPINGYEDT